MPLSRGTTGSDRRFLLERGAVSVEYAVLTAAIIALCAWLVKLLIRPEIITPVMRFLLECIARIMAALG